MRLTMAGPYVVMGIGYREWGMRAQPPQAHTPTPRFDDQPTALACTQRFEIIQTGKLFRITMFRVATADPSFCEHEGSKHVFLRMPQSAGSVF